MEHRVFEIKFLDFGLIYDRRHKELLDQDSLLIRSRLMKKLFYLPPSLPLKDAVINYWQVVRKRDFFSAEQQLHSIFMPVTELVLLFQILTGYVLISGKSEFCRSSAYPWLVSPAGLPLEFLLGEIKKPQTNQAFKINTLQRCHKDKHCFCMGLRVVLGLKEHLKHS